MWVSGQREGKRAYERAVERSLVAAFDGSSVGENSGFAGEVAVVAKHE